MPASRQGITYKAECNFQHICKVLHCQGACEMCSLSACMLLLPPHPMIYRSVAGPSWTAQQFVNNPHLTLHDSNCFCCPVSPYHHPLSTIAAPAAGVDRLEQNLVAQVQRPCWRCPGAAGQVAAGVGSAGRPHRPASALQPASGPGRAAAGGAPAAAPAAVWAAQRPGWQRSRPGVPPVQKQPHIKANVALTGMRWT